MAGYENITLADPRNAVTAGLNDDGYVMSTVNNAAFPNDKVLQMMWIGGKYKATDNLTLIGSYYHETQNSYGAGALVGCSTNVSSFCSGSLNVVSFVADDLSTNTSTSTPGWNTRRSTAASVAVT